MKLHQDDIFEQDLTGNRQAVFSPCRNYRYVLTRKWLPDLGEPEVAVAFVGLNPSTADALVDDQTIRKCVGYAKCWGFSQLIMLNMFAFRSTDPGPMKQSLDPTGPRNHQYLAEYTSPHRVAQTICCWGANVDDMERMLVVESWRAIQRPTFCLGKTKSGMPKHPLYLAGGLACEPFNVLPVDHLRGRD